jgi:single-stranded DNA-binding protein
MGNMLFIGTDLRVASEVTFIPGAEAKRNHAILTVINNRGKHPRTNEDMTDEITLNFWGKYAGVAAHYLYPGKQINAEGRIQSYTEDTGQVRPNGGRKLNRKIEVVVDNMQLLGDSMKKINERIAKNILALKAAGRLPQDVVLSAEELLKTDKIPMTDFVPAVAAQSGRYGLARVWSKDHGFWDQKIGQVAPAAAPATAAPALDMTDPAAIAAHIANLQTALNNATAKSDAPAAAEAGADPFAG